jgi:hypothetical protein
MQFPDAADQIKKTIATLREFLNEASPQPAPHYRTVKVRMVGGKTVKLNVPVVDEREQLDDKAAAAHALKSLAKINACLSRLKKCSDVAAARNCAHEAIAAALDFASEFHQWTVIDNEKAIFARTQIVGGAPEGGKEKAAKYRADKHERNKRMAADYIASKGKVSVRELGRKHGLKKSAAANALKRGLAGLKK